MCLLRIKDRETFNDEVVNINQERQVREVGIRKTHQKGAYPSFSVAPS